VKQLAKMPPGFGVRQPSGALESAATAKAPDSWRSPGRYRVCVATAGFCPALLWAILLVITSTGLAGQQAATNDTAVRFCAVDVYVDSGSTPLAAYQLEFSVAGGAAKIVGIEGGELPAFAEPPYYDPKAMQNDKVIIAAFSLAPASQLPKGKTRVATIHLRTASAVKLQYEFKLQVAANSDGNRIPAEITVQERQAK
jgi:hypothetical protein